MPCLARHDVPREILGGLRTQVSSSLASVRLRGNKGALGPSTVENLAGLSHIGRLREKPLNGHFIPNCGDHLKPCSFELTAVYHLRWMMSGLWRFSYKWLGLYLTDSYPIRTSSTWNAPNGSSYHFYFINFTRELGTLACRNNTSKPCGKSTLISTPCSQHVPDRLQPPAIL